jgi:D-beta-D-heptose 7-phosphate kinase/D-beta-D-heptose 1-phosphate adenosyltransferase
VRRQRQVYDITGAGDMVLAMLGLALADGLDYPEAIDLAGAAAGVVVERIGSVGVTREELFADLSRSAAASVDKLVDRSLLVRLLEHDRRLGRSIVFTNGCFDILHAGHIQYLAEARAQGDLLVLGLNTDASVRRLGKGDDRPINDEASRAAVLSALACIDYICLFDEDTPLELIQAVVPDVLVKGADYKPEAVVGREFVEARGGRLHLAPLVPGKSTTNILKKARGGAS